MAASLRRAVLTGIGVLNPVGQGVAPYWESLLAGRSGVRPVQAFDPSGMPVRIAAEIASFDGKRCVLVGPSAVKRTWNAGRIFSGMPGRLDLLGPLPAAEVEALLARMEAARPE